MVLVGLVLLGLKLAGALSIPWWLIALLVLCPWIAIVIVMSIFTGGAVVASELDVNKTSHLKDEDLEILVNGKKISLEELAELIAKKK